MSLDFYIVRFRSQLPINTITFDDHDLVLVYAKNTVTVYEVMGETYSVKTMPTSYKAYDYDTGTTYLVDTSRVTRKKALIIGVSGKYMLNYKGQQKNLRPDEYYKGWYLEENFHNDSCIGSLTFDQDCSSVADTIILYYNNKSIDMNSLDADIYEGSYLYFYDDSTNTELRWENTYGTTIQWYFTLAPSCSKNGAGAYIPGSMVSTVNRTFFLDMTGQSSGTQVQRFVNTGSSFGYSNYQWLRYDATKRLPATGASTVPTYLLFYNSSGVPTYCKQYGIDSVITDPPTNYYILNQYNGTIIDDGTKNQVNPISVSVYSKPSTNPLITDVSYYKNTCGILSSTSSLGLSLQISSIFVPDPDDPRGGGSFQTIYNVRACALTSIAPVRFSIINPSSYILNNDVKRNIIYLTIPSKTTRLGASPFVVSSTIDYDSGVTSSSSLPTAGSTYDGKYALINGYGLYVCTKVDATTYQWLRVIINTGLMYNYIPTSSIVSRYYLSTTDYVVHSVPFITSTDTTFVGTRLYSTTLPLATTYAEGDYVLVDFNSIFSLTDNYNQGRAAFVYKNVSNVWTSVAFSGGILNVFFYDSDSVYIISGNVLMPVIFSGYYDISVPPISQVESGNYVYNYKDITLSLADDTVSSVKQYFTYNGSSLVISQTYGNQPVTFIDTFGLSYFVLFSAYDTPETFQLESSSDTVTGTIIIGSTTYPTLKDLATTTTGSYYLFCNGDPTAENVDACLYRRDVRDTLSVPYWTKFLITSTNTYQRFKFVDSSLGVTAYCLMQDPGNYYAPNIICVYPYLTTDTTIYDFSVYYDAYVNMRITTSESDNVRIDSYDSRFTNGSYIYNAAKLYLWKDNYYFDVTLDSHCGENIFSSSPKLYAYDKTSKKYYTAQYVSGGIVLIEVPRINREKSKIYDCYFISTLSDELSYKSPSYLITYGDGSGIAASKFVSGSPPVPVPLPNSDVVFNSGSNVFAYTTTGKFVLLSEIVYVGTSIELVVISTVPDVRKFVLLGTSVNVYCALSEFYVHYDDDFYYVTTTDNINCTFTLLDVDDIKYDYIYLEDHQNVETGLVLSSSEPAMSNETFTVTSESAVTQFDKKTFTNSLSINTAALVPKKLSPMSFLDLSSPAKKTRTKAREAAAITKIEKTVAAAKIAVAGKFDKIVNETEVLRLPIKSKVTSKGKATTIVSPPKPIMMTRPPLLYVESGGVNLTKTPVKRAGVVNSFLRTNPDVIVNPKITPGTPTAARSTVNVTSSDTTGISILSKPLSGGRNKVIELVDMVRPGGGVPYSAIKFIGSPTRTSFDNRYALISNKQAQTKSVLSLVKQVSPMPTKLLSRLGKTIDLKAAKPVGVMTKKI